MKRNINAILYIVACIGFLFALIYPVAQTQAKAKLENTVQKQSDVLYEFRLVSTGEVGKFYVAGNRSVKNENGAIIVTLTASGNRYLDLNADESTVKNQVAAIKSDIDQQLSRFDR